MENKKNKTMAIVLGIFALVIVTTTASFAFFTYSRTGTTTSTIISGDIEFSFIEGKSAILANAFPVSDSVGAVDTTGEYSFDVRLASSSNSNKMNYNVLLVDNNDETGINYFNNEQIKFSLVKNNTYVADTSTTTGVKLSDIDGFDELSNQGEGIVLENQEITAGTTDSYKLRIWISDEVNYSNTVGGQDNQESIGKYNSYKYSLKVKVTSGISNSISINNLSHDKGNITADLEDVNGLAFYAVTNSKETPSNNEWIEITNATAKNNVVRTSTDLITSKKISYNTGMTGTYYLHVKNKLNEVKSKKIRVVIPVAYGTAVEAIMELANTNINELKVNSKESTGMQTFSSTEYRYYGINPNNYVNFNDEMWRIIGVFDVDDGNGNIEKRVKIIRDESLYIHPYDNDHNDVWPDADITNLLNNGDYYNRTGEYESKGLKTNSKELIGNSVWYLGRFSSINLGTNDVYNKERENNSWTGQIGLMYPSDYSYSLDETKCMGMNMSSYSLECAKTSWLFDSKNDRRTISVYETDSSLKLLKITRNGTISTEDIGTEFGAECVNTPPSFSSVCTNWFLYSHPTAYLSADVKIVAGTGEKGDNAFQLSK